MYFKNPGLSDSSLAYLYEKRITVFDLFSAFQTEEQIWNLWN